MVETTITAETKRLIQKARHLKSKRCFKEAYDIYQKIIDSGLNQGFIFNEQGLLCLELNNITIAEQSFKKAIQLESTNPDFYMNLGVMYFENKEWNRAEQAYLQALKFNPNSLDLKFNLAILAQKQNQFNQAQKYYESILEVEPNHLRALQAYAKLHMSLGDIKTANQYYQKALSLAPNNANLQNDYGLVFSRQGDYQQAIACFEKGLHLDPNHVQLNNNIGHAFAQLNQSQQAIGYLQKALALNPNYEVALVNLVWQLSEVCDWTQLTQYHPKLKILTENQLQMGQVPTIEPLLHVLLFDNTQQNSQVAKAHSKALQDKMMGQRPNYVFEKNSNTKVRIGYLSADFHNHATMHLMGSYFQYHNTDQFDIYIYSYGPETNDDYEKKLKETVNNFRYIEQLSNLEAANTIYQDQIDILIDLKGYTTGARLEICALRPAPIQITYLGFPGSTGADFFDYAIVDPIVVPKEQQQFYSEKCLYMPCYQVNNNQQNISQEVIANTHDNIVFASFNYPKKISKRIFQLWMTILSQVPNSQLWLLKTSLLADNNLQSFAKAYGIDPQRLVFCESLDKADHLARLQNQVTLVLDTDCYNGHTTSSDALWAGVPVITLEGEHFAARVSSSLLYCLELNDCITHTPDDYCTLAIELARNPEKLKSLKHRLRANRDSKPLFNTQQFVETLERHLLSIKKEFDDS